MRLSILWNIFLRDFKKQKKRMFLTLMAIFWGTMSIMLLLAFGEGFKKQLMTNQKGMGDGIVLVWGGQTSIPYQGFGKGRSIRLGPDEVEYLRKKMPELEVVAGEYTRWGTEVRYQRKSLNQRINGVYPEYESLRNFRPEMGGRMINKIDMEKKRRVAFLGWDLKERLFGEEMKVEDVVGQMITINSIPFTVIGVMAEKMQMGSYGGQDSDVIAIPATTFQTIYGHRYMNNLIYRPKVIDDHKIVEKRLYEVLGSKFKFDPEDDRALSLWDTIEGRKVTANILIGLQIFLGIIGALTLMIAAVGVTNIMYVSIKERTREIGVKMAIGARKSYILTQFLIEAFGITFFGGLIGMAISYIGTEIFKMIPMESDVMNFMGRPTVSLEIGIAVTLILGMLGFLAGLFPAMKAASVNPTEALRYE